MDDTQPALLQLDASFARALPGLHELWQADEAPAPELLVLNDELATSLGLDADGLRSPVGAATLVGNHLPEGAVPVAQAYAGHQFGGYSPRLGDGRALLLGELTDPAGEHFDLHLKGSGRTPFARGGDGKAAVGPMLREYLIAEAMHALGIRTTRALAVISTGEPVRRETMLPGAILARVASSHLRVGTFQYAAASGDPDLVRHLADRAIARHHPSAAEAANPYLAFYEAVLADQAELVASWMLVGFIHGVMNTDNTTISGETIDYGPCAFMDAFDPATVFSSIDHGGRYAYGNQPQIIQWNLARLAETVLPLFDEDSDAAVAAATEVLHAFPDRYQQAWQRGVRAKLGLATEQPDDEDLTNDLLQLLHVHEADFTATFRALSSLVRGDDAALGAHLGSASDVTAWTQRYRARLEVEGRPTAEVGDGMDRVNPRYIPRNHLVEEALAAATAGDLDPFEQLLNVVSNPYDDHAGWERYEEAAPVDSQPYQTFCGT